MRKLRRLLLAGLTAFFLSSFSVPLIMPNSYVIAATFNDVKTAANNLIKWAEDNGKGEDVQIFYIGEHEVKNQNDINEFRDFLTQAYQDQITEKTDTPFVYEVDFVYVDKTRTINHVDTNGATIAPAITQTGGSGRIESIVWADTTFKETNNGVTNSDWAAYSVVPDSIKKDWKLKTGVAKVANPTADATANAIYERIDRTVTFNANGGTGSMTNQTIKSGLATALKANAFSRTGYTFKGWNTKADGTGTAYTNKQSVTLSANTTLYAQWTPYTMTINYYPGIATGDDNNKWDGKTKIMSTAVLNYNGTDMAKNGLPNTDGGTWKLTKEGYHVTSNFLINSATSTNKISQNTSFATIQDFATAVGLDLTTGNKTVNLYAEMLPNTYTVKFNGNGSTSGSMSNLALTYDTAKTLTANAFKKTGYRFDGWAKTATGAKAYADKASVKNLTAINNGTVELYARWIQQFTVTFTDALGKTLKTQTVDINTAATAPANPTRTGYTFAGWDKTFSKITANTTVNAKWTANTYNVKFNANGGTGTMADESFTYDTAKALTANAFQKTGYTFNGWNTKADGSGTSYTNKASVKNLAASGTVNLYAQWKINQYNITFNGNTSTSGSMTALTKDYNTKVTLTANAFAKTGHVFNGWNTKTDGTGTAYANKATFTVPASNTTLYAQWVPGTYSVTFNGNGSTSGSTTALSGKTYNSTQTLTANGFKRTGYTFNNWNTKADGSGNAYANKASFTIPAGNTTLYAQWKINQYKVTFNGNGNTGGSTAALTKDYNTNVTLTANGFTKTGHTFKGWNTKADGTGTTYTNKASFTIPASDTTLYAQWDINHYNVTFDGNGSTSGSTVGLSNKPYNAAQTLTANGFKRTGYTFNGWNTKADGSGVSYADKASFTIPASNSTLYAQWKINQYTVTFTDGQGKTLKTEKVDYGKSATAPANPTREGYSFAGWDKAFNNITANTTVTAKWTTNTYTVTFVDGSGNTLKTEKIEHGKAATAPNAPERKGSTFAGWDKTFNNITSDTTVTAKWNDTIAKNWYTIHTKVSPLFRLGTPNTKDDIRIQSSSNKTGQKFQIQRMSDGTYKIGTGTTIGMNVLSSGGKQTKYTDESKWEVIENSDKSVSFKNKKTGKFLSYSKAGDEIALAESDTNDTNYQRFTLRPFEEKYTVTFIANGKVVSRQNIKKGQSAKAPEGYTWNGDYSNVTKNITINSK